ncbi:MAG: hypothetical protein GSR85_04280 [Desulfurococcales archaeon]|nr:hypothetical protein [Desulfurococcales archaeon]
MITPAIPLVVKPYKSRKRLRTGEEREYTIYRINLPKSLATRLGLEGEGEDIILAYLTHAKWFHLFDWSNPEVLGEVLPRLTEREKLELCATLAPQQVCQGKKPHILLASPEDLKSLGIDPGKPITLEDLVEAIKRKTLAELQTKPATSK